MNLKDAFTINVTVNFSRGSVSVSKPKKKKRRPMTDAYESFLRGNWGAIKKRDTMIIPTNG